MITALIAQMATVKGEVIKTVPGFALQAEIQEILGSSKDLQAANVEDIPVYSEATFPQVFIDRLCDHSQSKICDFS